MAESAAVSSAKLVRVLEAFPDYLQYVEPSDAREEESAYRMTIGRVVKDWGDLLLDIAEQQPRSLSRTQTNMVETLLEGIGEIFRALNGMGTLVPLHDVETATKICGGDAKLLAVLEHAETLVARLTQREFASVWLEENAKSLYRDLRRAEKLMDHRNRLLGVDEKNLNGGDEDSTTSNGPSI